MKPINELYPYTDLFGTVAKQQVLLYLCNQDKPVTVKHMATDLKLSNSSLSFALISLIRVGIVEYEYKGVNKLQWLHKDFIQPFKKIYKELDLILSMLEFAYNIEMKDRNVEL